MVSIVGKDVGLKDRDYDRCPNTGCTRLILVYENFNFH